MQPLAPPTFSDVTYAILCGGRARRLGGVPKGLLRVNGVPILERLLVHAPRFARTFLVTGAPEPYQAYALEVVPDILPGHGAPGGVHAALAAARTPWVFAVGVDMPFVQVEVVEELMGARGPEVDLVYFEVLGHAEPLLAVYRAKLAEPWAARLQGGPAFRELFQGFRSKVLPQARLAGIDPELRSVRSVNTPDDLVRLGGQWPGPPPKSLP